MKLQTLTSVARYETVRLLTLGSTLYLIVGLVLAKLLGALTWGLNDPTEVAASSAASILMATAIAGFAASSTAGAYRSGMAKLTHLLFPDRWSTAVVRPLTVALLAVSGSALATAAIVAYVLVTKGGQVTGWNWILGALVFHGLASVVGSGVGMLLRRPVPAVGLVVGWILVGENLIANTAWASDWLRPFGSGMALTGRTIELTSGPGQTTGLGEVTAGQGGLLLAVAASLLWIAGAIRHHRTDLT